MSFLLHHGTRFDLSSFIDQSWTIFRYHIYPQSSGLIAYNCTEIIATVLDRWMELQSHELRVLCVHQFCTDVAIACADNSDENVITATEKLRSELYLYFALKTINKDSCICTANPPTFAKVARKLLCIQAISVSNLFSLTGLIVTKKRSGLKPCNINIETFLFKNLQFVTVKSLHCLQ